MSDVKYVPEPFDVVMRPVERTGAGVDGYGRGYILVFPARDGGAHVDGRGNDRESEVILMLSK